MKANVSFPLYKRNSSFFILNPEQKKVISQLNWKITSGEYTFIEHSCLCGNTETKNDLLVSEVDMYGIAANNYICSKCGLIRSDDVFDERSLSLFYENEYKSIFYNTQKPDDAFFKSESDRGQIFFALLEKLGIAGNISSVFEVGCAMGGVLMPFKQNGKTVGGCDFGLDYIEAGKKRGLDLYLGELSSAITSDGSQDLLILSHVMEHFNDPVNEMQKIIRKVKPGKYLLVEVPGLFADLPGYDYYPNWYFQRAHVFNFFYKDFLSVFFDKLGLRVLYGDERCTFVVQKPNDYTESSINFIYASSLTRYPQMVRDFLADKYREYDYYPFLNKTVILRTLVSISEKIGLRNAIRTLRRWF